MLMVPGFWVLLTMMFAGFFGPAYAEELAGYPFDPRTKEDAYSCIVMSGIPIDGEVEGLADLLVPELCIDANFAGAAENILRQAFARFVSAALKPEVFACAEASDIHMSRQAFVRRQIVEPLRPKAKDKGAVMFPALVFISALDPKNSDKFSEGYLNYYDNPKHDSQSKPWNKHISIAVRKDLVGAPSFGLGQDTAFWSGVIAIAFLKNMGIDENLIELARSFSHKFAECILWDGKVPEAYRPVEPAKEGK